MYLPLFYGLAFLLDFEIQRLQNEQKNLSLWQKSEHATEWRAKS